MINHGIEIHVVDDHYAVIEHGRVVGTVAKCNDTQWGFFPFEGSDGVQYVRIPDALDAALKHHASRDCAIGRAP